MQVSRLRPSYDVERGELVETVILSGGVELKIRALAESGARTGEWVWLREPTSGKKLRGRVTAPKRVAIEVKDVGNSKTLREEIGPHNLLLTTVAEAKWRRETVREPSPIERYVQQANDHALKGECGLGFRRLALPQQIALGRNRRDQRAYQLDDLVTIVVAEKASAIARGSTTSARRSRSKSEITALAGVLPATSPLANLATLGGESKLDGCQGETTRSTN